MSLERALELARDAESRAYPNPTIGAVAPTVSVTNPDWDAAIAAFRIAD